jgi:hypothetical protein
MNTHTETIRTLADEELLVRVKGLAARERGATAELVAHLAEVEARKLHLASGYASMFAYCSHALHLTDHEAFNRIEAARAGRRFPVVLDRLAEGAVSLTAVRLLAPHLTEENHAEVLESARGGSRSDIEKIVARLAPRPDAPTSIRKLPTPRLASETTAPLTAPRAEVALDLPAPAPLEARSPGGSPPAAAATPVEARRAAVDALAPDRYKLQVTISGGTLEKLEQAKDMLRHANPSGDVSQILDRALSLLLADLAKKKFGATDRPRSSKGVAPGSHDVSAAVRRVVSSRDTGRCGFVSEDGHRCNERGFVEFHHIKPHAIDGPPTVPNIALRCQAHNLYEWERLYTEVRRQEEEWLSRRVAAGVLAAKAGRARSETSAGRACPLRRPPAQHRVAAADQPITGR